MDQKLILGSVGSFIKDAGSKTTQTLTAALKMDHDANFGFTQSFMVDGRVITVSVQGNCQMPATALATPAVEAGGNEGTATGKYDDEGNAASSTPEIDQKKAVIKELKEDHGIKATMKSNLATLTKKLDKAKTAAAEDTEPEDKPDVVEEDDPFGLGDDEPTAPVPTQEEVRQVLFKVMEKHDKPYVAKLLKGVGASKLSEVNEDKYAELVKLGEAALED